MDGCGILCIGDSFTSGKRGRGIDGARLKNAPYFKFLESRLVDEAKKAVILNINNGKMLV